MGGLVSTTISYFYKGEKKEIPFFTSQDSLNMDDEEYRAYSFAQEEFLKNIHHRMYSDSFLDYNL